MSLKQMQLLDGASAGKQEPLRIMGFDCVCGRRMVVSAEQGVAPAPQRTWVGLTDKAVTQVIDSMPKNMKGFMIDWDLYEFSKAIEAKLKEKNT